MAEEINNSVIIKAVLRALFAVTGRRESQLFAVMAMESIVQMLAEKYVFLKHVTIKVKEGVFVGSQEVFIDVPRDIVDIVESHEIGEFIESLIRIVLMDLKAKAGLFFLSEFKKHIGPDMMPELRKIGVNLGNMQLEQRYLYARLEKEKAIVSAPNAQAEQRGEIESNEPEDEISLFGYGMDEVSSFSYDPDSMVYTLCDKNGKQVDKLNLDSIVNKLSKLIEFDSSDFDASSTKEDQHRVRVWGNAGEIEEPPETESATLSNGEEEKKIEITKKEYQFLEMLFEQDMDAEKALELLEVNMNDLEFMVKRLLGFEFLKHVSNDEVELTEFGINYMMSLYGA